VYFAVNIVGEFLFHTMSLPIGPHCTAAEVFVVFLLKASHDVFLTESNFTGINVVTTGTSMHGC